MSSDETQNKPSMLRLNKYLAFQLGISRREADNCIEQGRVTINNERATLGARFTESDSIKIDGKPVTTKTKYQYVAFHKPVGYVCSRKSQGDNQTIYTILPKELHTLNPVGRLDKNSSGLLFLTNDGDFAYRMTHPKFTKTKIYEVTLKSQLEPLHQQMISDFGVQLEDGLSKLGLMRLSEQSRTKWQVTMNEGRNRQIRRTFAALGYDVGRLHRTNFGNYSIGDIKPGEYKIVDMR